MKIRADMHLHPSLPKDDKKAESKARKWWAALKKNGITCMISAEHCYRDFRRNYEVMARTAPKKFIVFPGVELLSKEGIDIVMFYKDSSIYHEKNILKPMGMKAEKIVDLLNRKGYGYFIPHPFTLGTTSIFKIGRKKALRIILKSKGIEAHNSCMKPLAELMSMTRMSNLFRKKYEKILKVENVPSEYLAKAEFIAGGSDAHRPSCAGSCVEVDAKSAKPDDVYSALVNSRKKKFLCNNKLFIPGILVSGKEAFSDWLAKAGSRIRT